MKTTPKGGRGGWLRVGGVCGWGGVWWGLGIAITAPMLSAHRPDDMVAMTTLKLWSIDKALSCSQAVKAWSQVFSITAAIT